MYKLTKKEALEKTAHMWRWIAEECEKRKRTVDEEEYFKYCGEVNYLEKDCYLCEYKRQHDVNTCLIKKWNLGENHCRAGCCDYEYGDYLYRCGNDYQKYAKAANAIADLAEMELKKLEKEADVKNTLLK